MTIYQPAHQRKSRRLLLGLLTLLLFLFAAVLAAIVFWQLLRSDYQQTHADRIFTGVFVWNRDLGGLTKTEAITTLNANLPAIEQQAITIVDGQTGQTWTQTLGGLGVSVAVEPLVEAAYQIGRTGTTSEQQREQAMVWYEGRDLGESPAVTINEAPIDDWLDTIVNESTSEERLQSLDRTTLRSKILTAVTQLEPATIALAENPNRVAIPVDLSSDETIPVAPDIETETQPSTNIDSPITLYIDEPEQSGDLARVQLNPAVLSTWVQDDEIDQEKARQWIQQYATKIARQPVRARFYFDDLTRELVLIEPHQNGRQLDVDRTLDSLISAIESGTRAIPFAVEQIIPTVHSDITGAELGITEELTKARRSTSFWDSPPERRHNIARAAQNFYGVVVAPDEEFSFNALLGEVSEEQGYEEGLIIAGGQTTKEVGGGICQVSTSIYQAAFWGGFTLGKRQEHGYRVPYYESNPMDWDEVMMGMDATVYSPIIDFTFVNNTPHHLLIENYFDGEKETLTVKMYSTDIGRTVSLSRTISAETEQTADKCKFNPELDDGEVKQTEWGIGGADVVVERYVFNQWGDQREYLPITSKYYPTSNLFEYGPNVDPDQVCIPAAPEPDLTAEAGQAGEFDATAVPDWATPNWSTPTPGWWVTPEAPP